MPNVSPLWIPSEERIAASNIQQFIQHINMQGEAFENYQQLHQWSVADKKKFWLEIWQFCDVIGFCGECIYGEGISRWQQFVPARDTIWFPQAQLNYAENLLSYAFQKPEGIAIWFKNENGQSKQITWQQLSDQVSVVQQWLVQNGVSKGDVVAAYLPHIPETIVAMLAATSLGAIWTSSAPEDDAQLVIQRLKQTQPKILFCCNGYTFNGKNYVMEEANSIIVQAVESIENTCQIEYLQQRDYSVNFNDSFSDWQAILASYLPRGLAYERIAFNEPLFILHSQSEGAIQCVAHSVGGTVLNHLKEHQLHCDIQPGDRVLINTQPNYAMWNWHVSALASGATLIIYDGCPVSPQPTALWDLAEESHTTLLGSSSEYIQTLQNASFPPGNFYSLTSLKTLCITNSMLASEQFDYIFDQVKPDMHLVCMSGDSDILGSFVLGNPVSPVYRGECQAAGLGFDIDAVDGTGKHVHDKPGHLICRNSFPNQPIGFWHDDGKTYSQTYWSQYPGAWYQGTLIEISSATGGIKYFL